MSDTNKFGVPYAFILRRGYDESKIQRYIETIGVYDFDIHIKDVHANDAEVIELHRVMGLVIPDEVSTMACESYGYLYSPVFDLSVFKSLEARMINKYTVLPKEVKIFCWYVTKPALDKIVKLNTPTEMTTMYSLPKYSINGSAYIIDELE